MAFEDKKFVGADALSELSTKVKTELDKKTDKAGALTNVSYDTTNKKFTKTTQGAHDPITTDIVTTATLKTDMGIADFDGTFSSLKSKPTTISGYGITDAKVENNTVTIGSDSVTALTQEDVSSTYDSSGTSPVDGKAIAAALGTLDVESVGGTGKYISEISETDGKISATAETMDSTPTSSSTKAVTSDGIYEYVNSSVATNTAYFIGTFDSVEELEEYSEIVTNNDYAFVTSTDSSGNTLYNRYKYNGSTHTWSFEYALNNSSFTSAQWATIQSGLTSSDKTKLDGIQSGANKTIVDSAMSSSSTNPVQNKVVYTALSGKQDTLTFDSTPTQNSANPVTSAGIYTDQQRQEAEIGVVANAGAKNLLKIDKSQIKSTLWNIDWAWSGDTASNGNASITINQDDTFTVVVSNTMASQVIFDIYLSNDDVSNVILSGCPSDGSSSTHFMYVKGTSYYDTGNGVTFSKTGPFRIAIVVASGHASGTYIFKPMIRPAAITDSTFQPYAKTNRELTLLTDEDRASLVELVDGGAKSLLNPEDTVSDKTSRGVTVTRTGDVYSFSGTAEDNPNIFININNNTTINNLPAGDYVAIFEQQQTDIKLQVAINGALAFAGEFGEPLFFTIPSTATSNWIRFFFTRLVNYTGRTGRIMICTQTAWKISQAYQPYRPSWQEIYENYATPIPKNADLDDYTVGGTYCVANSTDAATILHAPASNYGFILEVFSISDNTKYQRMTIGSDIYTRRKQSSGWQSWYKFAGTEVT